MPRVTPRAASCIAPCFPACPYWNASLWASSPTCGNIAANLYIYKLSRLVPIKMKSMVMTSYVLAIIIWSILAQTNPSKLSIILKFVNKNISTNHQRGKLSTNQGRPFIFADICCCFEKKISTILSTTELKALFSRYR